MSAEQVRGDRPAARDRARRPVPTTTLAKDDNVGRLLNLSARSVRAYLEQQLAAAGASFVMWSVLATLHGEGELIQRDLAELLAVESPTLTRHLAHMEAVGLVSRKRSKTDRRAAWVEMTPAGRALYRRLERCMIEGTARALRGLSTEDVEHLRVMLRHIQENTRGATAHHGGDASS